MTPLLLFDNGKVPVAGDIALSPKIWTPSSRTFNNDRLVISMALTSLDGVQNLWYLHGEGSVSLSTIHLREPPLTNWRKIWNPKLWPKISTFLRLLSHRRILTWDNLLKPGFYGPS